MKLIEKELEKSKVQPHEVNEVKLLLDSLHSEDLNILRKLSRNSEVNVLERNQGTRMQLETLDKTWNGNVYSTEEIKILCVHYKLRFLPSNYYKGKFDVETVQALKRFSSENNVTLTDYFLQTKFHIMAPAEMFSLSEAKYITKKQLDPVLFYEIQAGHFKKIHAWGTDFTILRRIIGWKWENAFHEFLFNLSLIFCSITLILSFFSYATMYNHYLVLSAVNLIVSIILSRVVNHTDDWDEIEGFFTPHNWNQPNRLK
jgi:hypothetical protein